MRLLEYESKSLLREAGLNTPRGELARSAAEAADIVRDLGCPAVLKSQIPLGGRGKAGGLAFVSSPEEASSAAEDLLSKQLRGHEVTSLWVEEQIVIIEELFLSVTYAPMAKCQVLLASRSGGVEIEAMADTVRRYHLPARRSWPTYRSREIASDLGFTGKPLLTLTRAIDRLVRTLSDLDALLVEVNPLVLTTDGRLVALDAHVDLDDDALYRHQDLVERFGLSGRGSRPQMSSVQTASLSGTGHSGFQWEVHNAKRHSLDARDRNPSPAGVRKRGDCLDSEHEHSAAARLGAGGEGHDSADAEGAAEAGGAREGNEKAQATGRNCQAKRGAC